ncbi:MAG TPA: carbohydrate ABC transporter permease [Candidatus Hydrogenedentes bacterium]|nr:carbohydrate ABC transporter permease [Candidatus Hydrogenedentota bacterium]HQH67289.1 carbohydrate ABC transporter permease [Candidatus Hydrogenedentota bacterium]HQM50168.1 carbohydrate ABC transporter permease [Candidatus Hydrogenedentota bacterium]
MSKETRRRARDIALALCIGCFGTLTLVPFLFALNNSFRTNYEMDHAFFGFPENLEGLVRASAAAISGSNRVFSVLTDAGETLEVTGWDAVGHFWRASTKAYRVSWRSLRPFMINTFFVCGVTTLGVVMLGSVSAYILSRYRFYGSRAIFYFIISTMMFPAALTLVPSFIVVRNLGLLNTYWAMILPYIAGGQVFATFVFKGFFDGLPEELFESARIDGAGHFRIYLDIVLPLSKPVLSVVAIMNILGTWNNFLWPFIVNTDGRYHVIASGLYVLATANFAQDYSSLFAAYMTASIPLLILFAYATKPFVEGVTSGAFKA